MKKKTQIPVTREGDASAPRGAPATWAGFGNLRDEMERFFDAFEPRLWFDRSARDIGRWRHDIIPNPAIDLTENKKAYAITAELPGLEPDAIEVKISNGMISISGEKSEEKKEEKENYHLSERRWGSFQRAIRLPDDVDQSKIDAQFAKGVLTINMPKSKEALAAERKITVKSA